MAFQGQNFEKSSGKKNRGLCFFGASSSWRYSKLLGVFSLQPCPWTSCAIPRRTRMLALRSSGITAHSREPSWQCLPLSLCLIFVSRAVFSLHHAKFFYMYTNRCFCIHIYIFLLFFLNRWLHVFSKVFKGSVTCFLQETDILWSPWRASPVFK